MVYELRRSFANRSALARAPIAGCYCCLATFAPVSVTDWADDDTALCPRCGTGSVLPAVDDAAVLRGAQARWLGLRKGA